MPRLVMKFGGTSVADVDRIRNVAAHVKREVDAGHEVAVVVSAMAGKTNELVAWCEEAGSHFDNPNTTRRRLGRTGDGGASRAGAQGHGAQGALMAGWQIPLLTDDAHGSARIAAIDGCGSFRASARARSPSSPAFRA